MNKMNINLDFIYPIGSIYLTTNTISPSVLFGGTWERIMDDAYLKIATGSTAGNLDGTSSEHKIPIASMPSHSHGMNAYKGASQWADGMIWCRAAGSGSDNTYTGTRTYDSGGGEAYYPYYYDVFVWKRTS